MIVMCDGCDVMQVIRTRTLASGLMEVVFATTPVMSTYLLAMVIGEFDSLQGRTTAGTLVRWMCWSACDDGCGPCDCAY